MTDSPSRDQFLHSPASARVAGPAAETELPFDLDAEDEDPLDAVELARIRLALEDGVSDVTIAASLAQIAARPEQRERWLAAFASPVGKHLASRGTDLSSAIEILLALAPRHQG